MSDLISRQDVIDAILAVTGNSSVRELYEHVQEHGLSDMWSGGVNAAIDIIIAVPSAQPERKKGRWINAYPDIEPNPMFMYGICSECGFEQSISDKLNYCPNCGADMKEDLDG